MLSKIAMSLIFVCLILAVFISVSSNGTITEINLSNNFYSFMSSVARKAEDFNIQIPAIPTLPSAQSLNVDDSFVGFVNGFFAFVNFLIQIINILVSVLNIVIRILEFIYIIITDFDTFKSSLLDSNSSSLVSAIA